MAERFGLEFRIVDSEAVREIRRTRGLRANPFSHYPRLIVSIDWLKREENMRLMRDLLPADPSLQARRFDLLVVDEVHMCAPAGRGKYATDSQRTRAIRELAPHFEHRVFLSATPHNGYQESYTALLELLDPQRFARGVKPSDEAVRQVVVRRLKSELREVFQSQAPERPCDPSTDLSGIRFPYRCVSELEVQYPSDEQRAHDLLMRYTELRRAEAARTGRKSSETAADFTSILLKKRLFSSPAAFARTLEVHRATLEAKAEKKLSELVDERPLQAAFDRLDEEIGLDEEMDRATEEALMAAAEASAVATPEQLSILDELQAWANRAATRPDAKTKRLLDLVEATCRPNGQWNDERIILFTEFRDTQTYIARLLHQHDLAGPSGERLALIYGGMDRVQREALRMQFQAHPSKSPIRILLATDAASEGIDLQRQCHRLVHIEIPFSPTKLEQRNGRVDRHLQPSPRVFIYHFVGAGWQTAAPHSTSKDLAFLGMIARKVDQIRDDLGSVGPVLADEVQRQLLGGGGSVERALSSAEKLATRQRRLNRLERDLRERLARLADDLKQSRIELGIAPESVKRVLDVGLRLGRQAPLEEKRVRFSNGTKAVVYLVPPLTGSWKQAATDLIDPLTLAPRPITFDHDVAKGNEEVVLAHLGHPLVSRALRLLRAEIWSSTAELSRVSARVADVESLTVIAHARMVVTGGDANRLHEEVVVAGGTVKDGRFRRIDTLRELDAAMASATDDAAGVAAQQQILHLWPQIEGPLQQAVESRSNERAAALAKNLQSRRDQDIRTMRQTLSDLQKSIRERLADIEDDEQLTLGFDDDERRQWQLDKDALSRRIARIPEEIEREEEAIRVRYSDPVPRPFPAAVTFLVPRALAKGRMFA
jgi:superfamily II DNA/RNA helicase